MSDAAPALKTSDEIRAAMLAQYELAKPHLASYREYAIRVAALSQEYHAARFKDIWPALPIEELVLIATFDARETPASLDTKLAQLKDQPIKRIIFDQTKAVYSVYA